MQDVAGKRFPDCLKTLPMFYLHLLGQLAILDNDAAPLEAVRFATLVQVG